jgi:hypothetical protein
VSQCSQLIQLLALFSNQTFLNGKQHIAHIYDWVFHFRMAEVVIPNYDSIETMRIAGLRRNALGIADS